MRIYEADLVHFGLNLTSSMKKSYHKGSEDVFRVEDLDFCSLQITNTSLANINLEYFKRIVVYVKNIQKILEKYYGREVTYHEIRYELRNRKRKHMERLYIEVH